MCILIYIMPFTVNYKDDLIFKAAIKATPYDNTIMLIHFHHYTTHICSFILKYHGSVLSGIYTSEILLAFVIMFCHHLHY